MTFTLGACAREGGRGVVGILNACIVDFFCFPRWFIGRFNGSFVSSGVCGHIFGPVPKNIMEGTDGAKLFVTHLNWCIFERTCECL